MFFSPLRQNGKTFADKPCFEETVFAEGQYPVVIGNDVWINSYVNIISGVTIGDGAIILAGSTVYKSVPPYALYGGGSIIKYRYLAEDIEFLLRFKWWDKGIEWLEKLHTLLLDLSKLKEYSKNDVALL